MVFPFPQVLLHAAIKNAAEVLRSIGPSGLQFLHRIRDGLLHGIGGLLRLPRTPDCRGSISATVPPAAMPRPSVSKKDRTCIVLPPFTLFCTVSMPAPAQKKLQLFAKLLSKLQK